ncbi:MAG TPA: hypothetical protein VF265_09675 [Nevskiaceae bacterium]
MTPLVATYALNFVYQVEILALVVLGLGVVFGLLGVMNMAHGEFVMLGAYSVIVVQRMGLPFLWGLPVTLVVCIVIGWVAERLIVRPLRDRPIDTLLGTWGLSLLMRKGVEAVFGKGYQNVNGQLTGTIHLLGTTYPTYRIVLIVAIAVGFALLAWWYLRSPAGTRVKAVVGNPVLAQAVGINTQRMATTTFVCGVTVAGLAGFALAPLVTIEPDMGLNFLLNGFFVLIVGGLGGLVGLGVGSGVIGGAQVLVASLINQTAGYLTVLIIAIVFIWLKPNGLVPRR